MLDIVAQICADSLVAGKIQECSYHPTHAQAVSKVVKQCTALAIALKAEYKSS